MISHEQNNIHWPDEETLPPLDQKPTSTPASSWRGWSLWLRVLGVVVPLVGGFSRAFPIPGDIPLLAIFFLPVLIGVVSAGLFRSWWAMLIVPVAYTVGFYLAGVYRSGTFDYVLNSSPDGILEGTALLVGLGVVPIAIGAAIGIPISKKIEQRLQHWATDFKAPIPVDVAWIGGSSLLAAALVFVNREWSMHLSAAAGLVTAGYVTVELTILQRVYGLEVVLFVIGATIFGLAAYLWMMEYRRHPVQVRHVNHA